MGGVENPTTPEAHMDSTNTAKYEVEYHVRTGIDGSLVSFNTITVSATDETDAERVAKQWADDNDPHVDDRIDPIIQIVSVDELADPEDD